MTTPNGATNYRTAATLTPRVIRPGRPSLRTTFQLMADVGVPSGAAIDTVFAGAANVAMDWLEAKLPQVLPRQARDLENFDLDYHGQQQLSGIAIPDQGLWSIRLIQPDAPYRGRPAVAGRTWTTELALFRDSENLRFAVRILCASAPYALEPIKLTRPTVVIDMAKAYGLREVRSLDGQTWMLRTEGDLLALRDLLFSEKRTLPIIVLTQPDHRQWQLKLAEYVLDQAVLARRTQGMAHVACMPMDLGFRWTEMVGKAWSAFYGAVRTYYPRVDMEEDSLSAHPLVLPDRVLFWRYGDQEGEAAFASFLIDKVAEHAAAKTVDWGQCLLFADARARRAEATRARLKLEIQQQVQADESTALRARIEELQKAHDEEVDALRAKVDEAQSDAEEFDDLASQYKMVAELREREYRSLQAQNDALRLAVEKKTGESADASVAVPATYADMPDWVETQLAGRLAFHPRAVQGAKKARYEDVNLVYECLLLLAREYRDMRLGHEGALEAWNAGLARLAVRFDKSISRERAGEQGETYFVRYPIGSNRKQFLELHLRKGATKDDRYCLGIYFFYDEGSNQVIVGWLTSHLDTRAT